MSGSDPTTTVSLGGGGSDNDCPGQPFETVLGSPDPDVVATLSIGDQLTLAAVEEPARGVFARTQDGRNVGAVVRNIVALRGCLAAGFSYSAIVQRIEGGSVTIWVTGA
ncbi:hypothetical protein [Jatrophihabitans lederbergiae]|uniref:Uncharacterized protein n=1 Tax=Jatrophihabitans lederbergiae TaxID=3075547 RepID=A0ABU2JEJ6_9ACTN|nr:hypothetical protein [Jatrophihabitans sp. DSM 44399]MDT0263416.1 hypothetical protein [Jatrophihabitans sp. DSM 44399]